MNDDLQLRGAFTQTIARANLSQLAGARDIDFDNSDIVAPGIISDASVSQGNPLLEPFKTARVARQKLLARPPSALPRVRPELTTAVRRSAGSPSPYLL